MKREVTIFIFLVGCLFLTGLTWALHVVTNSTTGTSQFDSVNEDISFLYNLTINNTDVGAVANITQINITLPSTFTYIDLSFNTTLSNYSFTNTATLLSFTNLGGLIMNSTWHHLWFNATASTPGTFNITVVTVNASSTLRQNLSVIINDTTAPFPISFNAPGYTTHLNLSASTIAVNVTATDNGILGTINVTLYNSDFSAAVNASNSSHAVSAYFVNFTNITDGIYFVNLSVNDSNGNRNLTVPSLRIALDHVAPIITLDDVFSNRTALNISISISDATSGAGGSCSVVNGGGTISGNGSTQYLYRNGLDCGRNYNFNITCPDAVSLVGNVSGTFSTDGCASSDSGGGTGGGGGGTGGSGSSYWTTTSSVSSDDFSRGYSSVLQTRERLRISVDGEDHHVGIIDIDTADVTFNVSSTPQQAVLQENQTQRFDVSDDSYYDLSVTLNWINSSTTGANLTVRSIHELTPEGAAVLGISNSSTLVEGSNESGSADFSALFSGSAWWIWIIIALALIAGVLALWKIYDRHQRLHGFKSENSS